MDGRLLGGRYRLLEALANGGMASVWRAADEQTGEIVAIKRLHPHLVADEAARQRLRREAISMATIRHRNVVAVREAVIDEDQPALVIDFVEGRSLADVLADGHPFDEIEALAIAAAVADGLAAAHDVGVVHRDVKPANVLIAVDGVARLSDFGISGRLDDESALTADYGVIGTLRYLAPERLAGRTATPATDTWGLGAVLYEMLAGEPAVAATTLADRVDAAPVTPPRPDGLTDPAWEVLSRSLATDPDDRYPDGGAMAAALHALPGLRRSAAPPVDSSAPTEVVPVPTAAAAATVEAAVARTTWLTGQLRVPSGVAWAIGVVGALILIVALTAAGFGPRASDRGSIAGASPTPLPSATTSPAVSVGPTDASTETARPGKGRGNGRGKGTGNGGG